MKRKHKFKYRKHIINAYFALEFSLFGVPEYVTSYINPVYLSRGY